MDWITKHWAEIGLVLVGAVRLAESIAKLTPSQKDDKIVAKIKAVVAKFFSFGAK